MRYAIDRLKEPSTYLAIGAMLGIFGINVIDEGTAQSIAEGVAALCLVVAGLMKG